MAYLNLVNSFIYGEPLFRAKLDALAENDAAIKGANWALNNKAVFYQAAVPVGWTQDVSQHDKALRVVGSTGGGVAAGTALISSTVTVAHTHAGFVAAGSHTHAYGDHTHKYGVAGSDRATTMKFVDMEMWNQTGGGNTLTVDGGDSWDTPGAITLGTEAGHDHSAATASALLDFGLAYCDVLIGTKDAPGGTYTNLTTFWSSGTKVDFDPFAASALNDNYNKANLMPAGTVMVWAQASAPTGWTKTATVNDRMLRVVSSVGGTTGGSRLISNGMALAHTHTLTAVSDHTHTVPNHAHLNQTGATYSSMSSRDPNDIRLSLDGQHLAATSTPLTASGTVYGASVPAHVYDPPPTGGGNTGAAGGHTHIPSSTLADLILAYVDVIQCSKDSGGEPTAFIDLSAEFAWKKLTSKQRLNKLAANDAYVQYHVTPSGSKTLFYMPSPPAGWTKLTDQHDKALRMVSGATGGAPGGGAQLLSSVIPLQHIHAIPPQADHTHSMTHVHPVQSRVDSGGGVGSQTNNYIFSYPVGGGHDLMAHNAAGALQTVVYLDPTSQVPTEALDDAGAHDHGGVTDTQLTDITLAYADVIYCRKD